MIKCYVDNNKKIALINDNNHLYYKSFSSANFADELETLDTFANILQIINRVSIDLKIHREAKTKEEVLFVVDNKEFIEFIKPDGEILKKVTKSLKKQITNNNLKLNLGCTLAELNTMFNVDIICEDIPEVKLSEIENFDSSIESKDNKQEVKEELKDNADCLESKNNDATEVSGKINLELDFFPSNDIINLSEIKVIEINNEVSISDNDSEIELVPNNDTNNVTNNNINNDDESTSLKNTFSTDSLKSAIESEIKYLKSNIENNAKLYKNKLDSALNEYNNLKKRLDDFSMNDDEELELLQQIKDARLKIRQSENLYNIYSNLEIAMKNELSKCY